MKNPQALLFAIAMLGAGCATKIQPVSSTPPAKSLRVTTPIVVPYQISTSTGTAFITMQMEWKLPAGIYLIRGETSAGYCFEAPSKLTLSSFISSAEGRGGIFWERGRAKPDQMYAEGILGMGERRFDGKIQSAVEVVRESE